MADDQSPLTKRGYRNRVRKLLFGILAAGLMLALLEGLASAVWTGCEVFRLWSDGPRVGELREEFHCEYDSELGWVNRPDIQIADFYGEGRTITINELGLRSHEGLETNRKADACRTICLGDSFTLGYGVDDRKTFPFLLEQQSGGLLHVSNVGQGGYSIGQNWLWLRRLMPDLKPSVVVCIFIVEDFRRLGVHRTSNGFGVPRFNVVGERIQIENVPVPAKLPPGVLLLRPGQVGKVLQQNSAVARTLSLALPDVEPDSEDDNLITGLYIIQEIKRLCEQEQCAMAFVLTPTLPELFDYESKSRYEKMAGILEDFMKREQVPFTSLQSAFMAERERSGELFLAEQFHHYSEQGNELVAAELGKWLPAAIDRFPASPR